MSASKIIAQAADRALIAFPGWRLPTLYHWAVSIDGSGNATNLTDDTAVGFGGPSLDSLVSHAGAGLYNFVGPAARFIDLGTFSFTYVSGSGADWKIPAVNYGASFANFLAAPGISNIRVGLTSSNAAAFSDPPNNSKIFASVWMDLG